MVTRREFLYAAAAGAAMLARIPAAFAATYDLIIKGGRVIDPRQNLDEVTNILIEDELLEEAIHLAGVKTKKETVEIALREFVNNKKRKSISSLKDKNLIDSKWICRILSEFSFT